MYRIVAKPSLAL